MEKVFSDYYMRKLIIIKSPKPLASSTTITVAALIHKPPTGDNT